MRFSAVSGLSHTRIRCGWCGRKFPSIWVLWGFAAGGDGRWMVGPHEPSVAFWGKIHYLLHLPTPMVIATKKKPFGEKKKKISIAAGNISASIFPPLLQPPLLPLPPEWSRRLFPPLFPADAKIREAGGSGEAPLGSQQPWKAALVVAGREAWSCLSELKPYILMAFWLDIQSTAESRKRKRLWHIYTVCWHWLLKKKNKKKSRIT